MNASDAAELRRSSIRLAVRFAALILVLFAILTAVTFAIVGAGQAETTSNTLANAARVDSPQDAPSGVLVAIRDNAGTLISRDAPSWFPVTDLMNQIRDSDDTLRTTKTVDGRTFDIRTTSDRGRVVQTALDTRENTEEFGRLATGLAIAGALAVIGSGFVATVMARRAMRPMADALALQRRFVTDASHELRTPLTLLSTRAQLLRRQVPGHEAGEVDVPLAAGLDEILQDSRELTAILEDLLIAADPRESVDRSDLDLAVLADEAVATLATEAGARGIALSTTGEDGVFVHGARVSLLRLYTALIANALDHARREVTVDVRARGKLAEVRVRDDGAGFPDGVAARAFDRFATSRTAPASSSGSRHYGLGLALVAEVATQHGGRVTVEATQPGGGAVVRVTLPLSSS